MDRPSRPLTLLIYALLALVPLIRAQAIANLNPRALIPDMVAGTAYRPYVYRALVPRATQALDALLPGAARAAADSLMDRTPWLRERWHWTTPHASWYVWTLVLQWLSLLLFAFAFERLAPALLGTSGALPALGAGVMLLLVPIHFGFQNFVYDFPQLALFTLALALLAERKWLKFEIALAVAVLNKETSLLLVAVFVIWAWRVLPGRQLAAHALAQLLIAAVVVLALRSLYAHNPGMAVEFHLQRNLHHQPGSREIVHAAAYSAMCFGAVLGAPRLPRVAFAALVVGTALTATTLFLGFLGEYRDFYELFPLLGVMMLARAQAWLEPRGSTANPT